MARPPLVDKNQQSGLVPLGPIPSQAPVASFNANQFESLIQTKGFKAIHYRHAPNPDKRDVNGPTNPNSQAAHRAFVYYKPQVLWHVPQSHKMEDALTAIGIWGKGSVMFNLSGTYEGSDDIVHVRNRDLIVFPSLTDITEETFEYNPTGHQQLRFKVRGVDRLFDAEREYVEDRDFEITEKGQIAWLRGGIRPDFRENQGAVISIVYFYTPIYIIQSKVHSLRVIPSNDTGQGGLPRDATYAPQLVIAKPSILIEEQNLLDFSELPPYPDYAASKNTTGGSV